jgi:hypothetical protein
MFCGVPLRALAFAARKASKVTPDEANRRVDITIDGQPFTSYIWPDDAEEACALSRLWMLTA